MARAVGGGGGGVYQNMGEWRKVSIFVRNVWVQ